MRQAVLKLLGIVSLVILSEAKDPMPACAAIGEERDFQRVLCPPCPLAPPYCAFATWIRLASTVTARGSSSPPYRPTLKPMSAALTSRATAALQDWLARPP